MAPITEAVMYYYSQLVFLPLILLLSFGLFQYLFIMYYKRRNELRGVLLLASAFVGFAVLVPLAHPNEELVRCLNDISEACSTMTFLIQITIIGRDSNKKVKIRTLRFLALAAEALIAAEFAVILLDFIAIGDARVSGSIPQEVNEVIEDVSLVFIFVFRFYYLALITSARAVLQTRKLEIAAYAVFLTHKYPFLALEASTHVSWTFVQGVYHRLAIVACIGLTIRNKLRLSGGGQQRSTTFRSQHMPQANPVSTNHRRTLVGPDVGIVPAAAVTTRGPMLARPSSSAVITPAAHP